MIDPVAYFLLSLKASLFSTGGQGNLPSLHQDFVARGWASDQQFAQALAVGQLSPGPTGIWPVALGYIVAGVTGAGIASLALVLPPLLVLPMARLHRRVAQSVAVRGFLRGLALAVAASVPVIVVRVVGSYGYDLVALPIAVGSFVLILSARLPPVAVLGIAAVVGVIVYK